MKDVIKRIEILNEKIQNEGKLIENINMNNENKIKNSNNTNNNNNNNNIIEKSEEILNGIKGELDFLLKEINLKMQNEQKEKEQLLRKTTYSKKKKSYSKKEFENFINENKKEFDTKFNSEKHKHENEKKTILKVLEEKCEKYNMMEIENSDLSRKIKILETKMPTDEKGNKKILMKLEQNIYQLNFNLENCVAEKSKISINYRILEKKLYMRNLEFEKVNKEFNELKDQVIILFFLYFFIVFSLRKKMNLI